MNGVVLNILVQARGGAAEIKSQCVFKCDVQYGFIFLLILKWLFFRYLKESKHVFVQMLTLI